MRFQGARNAFLLLSSSITLFLHGHGAEAHPADKYAARTRIRLNSDWKFRRTERIEDGVIYDLRPDANGTNLQVLKPWILPTANEFIQDPEEHHKRPSEEPNVDIPFVKHDFDDNDWAGVKVPHDWAVEMPFLTGEDPIIPTTMGLLPVYGVGWYRRTLSIAPEDLEGTVYLDIDGGMSYPMVWVNGHLVGGWPFGYNSFRLDITQYLNKGNNNQLSIRVENPYGRSSRWYPGAGLYRNVWLTKVSQTHVAQYGTTITTKDVSADTAKVDLVLQVQNDGDMSRTVTVKTEIHELNSRTRGRGRRVAEFPQEEIEVSASSKKSVSGTAIIRRPRLWGPPPSQTPHLYVATTSLYAGRQLLDTYETRFGVRSLWNDPNEGLFVNEKPVRLQGVNQHHDLGPLGAAYNERAAERQLEKLQEIGVNAIRIAHNPPAPELLDLTDRMGFLVIDEIFDFWAREKTELDFHLIWDDWSEADLRTFLRRDRNHPSIMAWSYGNEVREQVYAVEDAGEIATYLRHIVAQEDPTRPSTASMHYASPDMPLARVQDIISLNYQGEGIMYGPEYENYTGMYKKPPQYNVYHEAFPDKLILGSEVASSLSLRGSYVFPVTSFNSAPANNSAGTDPTIPAVSSYELYTSDAGSSPDRVFLTQDKHQFVAGGFVWTGWDYLGEPYLFNTSTHGGHWGIFDLCGFKKDRAWLYQSRWNPDVKMAHILPHWNWPDREGQVTPVHVFTSADEAELFLNGKSLGRKKKEPFTYRFRWDEVVYEPGELHVKTYRDGNTWATDTVVTTGEKSGLQLKADRDRIGADGDDLSFITLEIVDRKGNVVPESHDLIKFSISGPGEIVATDNGFPADLTIFTSKERNAFNGLALAIVRGEAGRRGKITVTAESEGLGTAEVVIRST
ncbi:uncharacterized protein APUU_20305A [Aspergillus puulaauensis]|uniref:Beta-galactosidase n=1 Tax=Aspergillus puulaauensis TaxID=1220207 RepID=A0A7R7XEQ3_9EURO|nr:uncharacterized protein APUU_20305A [Aspergillus puulaauensis]BCS19873.1 hypothetical protein APUU_20305A [Aspergillus puulaauensis]